MTKTRNDSEVTKKDPKQDSLPVSIWLPGLVIFIALTLYLVAGQ